MFQKVRVKERADMGNRLREVIKDHGLTNISLARNMGYQTANAINNVTRGEGSLTYEFIMALSEAFPKLNMHWFLLGKGDKYFF